MKIDMVTVVTKKYKLELTEEQLVGLGMLSYRHEDARTTNPTFYRILPDDIRVKIGTQSTEYSALNNCTNLVVDWNA